MGYYFQGFILDQTNALLLSNYFIEARKIDLPQNISLIPMTEELFDQMNSNISSPSIINTTYLTERIENKLLELVGEIKVAYIEAEYFAGRGGQIAVIWNKGKREHLWEVGQDRINYVLRIFGVIADNNKDEFDTIELGTYRYTCDWLD